jgi:hypothetical protein
MKYIPHTKQDWLRFLQILFKAYLIIYPILEVVATVISRSYSRQFRSVFTFQVRAEVEKAHILECFVIAYLVCFIMLIADALHHFVKHQWRPAITNVLFIVGSIIFWVLCLPALAEAR